MASLLVIVFCLHLAIHLVNAVGASTISNILWNLYNRFPTPTSKAVREQRRLQAEFLKVRRELNSTSAQNEFAKWAKLDRQQNKLMDQLQKMKTSLDGKKAAFDRNVSILRWSGTNGLRFFLQFWHSKQPMFWLPQGWIPYYGEWLLSFPRAPLGSISIQAWGLACAAVILLVSDAISAVIVLIADGRTKSGQRVKGEPMKFGGETKKASTTSESPSDGKKEL